MKIPLRSRIIFYFLGVFLPVGSHIADYSVTHIFNARWPPHAKFHTGQTLMFSIVLGISTIYFASRRSTDKNLALLSTSLCAAAYWITQAAAISYPGTAFFDPEFATPRSYPLGIPAQLLLDTACLSLIALAIILSKIKSARWEIA